MSQDLETLRARLRALDDKLVRLIGERQVLALLMAEVKAKHGIPIRQTAVEKATIARQRQRARELSLAEDTVEQVMSLLIDSSVKLQEAHLAELEPRAARRGNDGN